MQQRSEPSQSAHCVRSQIPLFVTYGDIFPRSGGSLSSQGELFGIFRQVEQNLPLSGEVDLRSKDGEGSLQQAPSPSQALPRQLPQRGSQAVRFIAKVLGITRKFPAVLLALPLGELASPTGLD